MQVKDWAPFSSQKPQQSLIVTRAHPSLDGRLHHVCTYEYLWRINKTRRFAANPTTTVCYLWQLLICVYLYTYRALEGRLNIAPRKLAWNPVLFLATYGDVAPFRDFPVLEIKYRLQFEKQRDEVGHLSNGWSNAKWAAICLVSGTSEDLATATSTFPLSNIYVLYI